MGFYMFTFRSVTPSQRAERILKNSGYSCRLGRTPRWMEEQGCGYSLKIFDGEPTDVAMLLKNNGVAYRKIYLQKESGNMEELKL